jgi:hypothetical protein
VGQLTVREGYGFAVAKAMISEYIGRDHRLLPVLERLTRGGLRMFAAGGRIVDEVVVVVEGNLFGP